MIKTIFPSKVNGSVNAPASKSYFQRAVALAILAKGKTCINNLSDSNDNLAAIDIAASFGCIITHSTNSLTIDSTNLIVPDNLFCGEAGLGIRMFTPLAALFNSKIVLTGHGSLLNRPVSFIESPLQQLGVKVKTSNGLPPVNVQGPLKGGFANVDGSLSSQFLTGLIIALPMAKADTVLNVDSLTSIPYINMTIEAVKSFGGIIEHTNYKEFRIKGNQKYLPQNYFVEGDWSGAAATLVAGAIAGQTCTMVINPNSAQADVKIIDALRLAGAIISFENNSVTVKTPKSLKAFNFDATNCPDLFPVLTALAANCNGVTKIKGANRLTHKESNRALTLKHEFNKVGISIDLQDDIMEIKGGKILSATTSSHNDHRIAMAMALAALNASGPVQIEQAGSVDKSYPEFYDHLQTLGVKIQ